jgi:hypothetical protein
MDIKKRFQTSEEHEMNGVWVDIGDGTFLKVARMGNPKHREAMRALLAPFKDRPNDIVPQESIDDVLARTILVSWEGVTEDGAEVPYSHEKAVEYLSFKDFRDKVVRIASNMETYRAEALLAAEKN